MDLKPDQKYVSFLDSKVYHGAMSRTCRGPITSCGVPLFWTDSFRATPFPRKTLCKKCERLQKEMNDKVKELLDELINWICEGDLQIPLKTVSSIQVQDEDGDVFEITIKEVPKGD